MSKVRAGMLAAGAAFALAGCIDEKIVFRDRELFNAPADSLGGFLGYFDAANKVTSCGNCHAEKQAAWVETGHARAYQDLQASGQATGECFSCHTVSEKGNAATVASGWSAVQDSAYHDVQCESCHGAGYQHVQSVLGGDVIRPLASVAVDTGLANGCGECHAGEHQPFLEQWAESKHGYGGEAYLEEGGRSPCKTCHEGRAAIELNFGNTNDFVEKADTGVASYQPIVCATCHDPHDPFNEGQLRAPLGEPGLGQLCVKCHSRQGAPGASATRRGPHAAQGLLVIDETVGWIPPGFVFDTNDVVGSHGSSANKRLCASCHVYMYQVTDAATGAFVFNSVGHTFEAIQCLDAQGKPTAGPCADNERNFKGCTVSGCHLTEGAARTAFQVVRARMDQLTDQLWTDDGDAVMETTDGGLLPKVLAQAIAANNRNEMNLYDSKLSTAEGAIWNAQLAFTHNRTQWSSFVIEGQNTCTTAGCTTGGGSNTAHKSSGEGVHNPFLLEALLLGSIDAVRKQYGVSAPPFDETRRMTVPPGVRRASR
ncbi:MAG TPA: cytochrome c3 family protein [Gemmatimonadales bacterium]